MPAREEAEKTKKYLEEGKAGCLGGAQKIEQRIDEIVVMERASFKDALGKWGVDAEEAKLIDPVVVTGIWHEAVVREGKKDKKARGSHYYTYILGFTEKQVLFFLKKWNVYTTDTVFQTEEIFYKDVTGVSVIEKTYGSVMVLKVPGFDGGISSGYIAKGDLSESQVQGVKNLVREKKGA